jgi:hypothetical protein
LSALTLPHLRFVQGKLILRTSTHPANSVDRLSIRVGQGISVAQDEKTVAIPRKAYEDSRFMGARTGNN